MYQLISTISLLLLHEFRVRIMENLPCHSLWFEHYWILVIQQFESNTLYCIQAICNALLERCKSQPANRLCGYKGVLSLSKWHIQTRRIKRYTYRNLLETCFHFLDFSCPAMHGWSRLLLYVAHSNINKTTTDLEKSV